jgi:rhamnulokinase
MSRVAAVDIGAGSGRVVVCDLVAGVPSLTEVSRFPNGPSLVDGRWTWDVETLHRSVADGLAHAVALGAGSCGIDTWAIDYGVVDRAGSLIGPVIAYRDDRHALGVDRARSALAWDRHYSITGIQHLQFNTAYQLAVDDRLRDDTSLLLVPDLLTFWLTGVRACDVTNASTTALVDPRTRAWSPEILSALALPAGAFLSLDEPGLVRGPCLDDRLRGLPLIGVATHDTASAFAGTPVDDRDRALVLSLGTWALIGFESQTAVPSPESMALNVTHELGIDGTIRVLRNVSGMWLIDECRRAWAAADGVDPSIQSLLLAAAKCAPFAAGFDIDDASLVAPGQSPETIGHVLVGEWDGSRGAVIRTILESLVVRLAQRAEELEGLSTEPRSVLHVVGGASRIEILMQWLADATGKRVVAGPVEATAIGNAVVQWMSNGAVASLGEARSLIAAMPEIREYHPAGSRQQWLDFAHRIAR